MQWYLSVLSHSTIQSLSAGAVWFGRESIWSFVCDLFASGNVRVTMFSIISSVRFESIRRIHYDLRFCFLIAFKFTPFYTACMVCISKSHIESYGPNRGHEKKTRFSNLIVRAYRRRRVQNVHDFFVGSFRGQYL